MLAFQLSESSSDLRRFPIYLVSSSDGLTPTTGETGTPQIAKAASTSFTNATNTLDEIGNGYYEVQLTAAELDTAGNLTVRYNSSNVANFNLTGKVVSFDPFSSSNLGLTNLDAAVSSRSTHSSTDILSDATPFAGANIDAAISSRSSHSSTDILSDATPFAGANIDATISSRSTHSSTDVIAATLSELPVGQPSATPSLGDAIMLPYMAVRNKETQSSTEYTIHTSTGGAIAKASLSDDSTTVTKAEMVSSTA